MLLAYCVCVYLRLGIVHLYASVLLLPLTQLFSGWTLLNPLPFPFPYPPNQIPSSKNPNESKNNGKELFFCLHCPIKSVSFNGALPSTCSIYHLPTHQLCILSDLSVHLISHLFIQRTYQTTGPANFLPLIHSFIDQTFILTNTQAYRPYIHRTILRSMQPHTHPTIQKQCLTDVTLAASSASCEGTAPKLLNTPVFLDVTLCSWVSPDVSKDHSASIFRAKQSKTKITRCFKATGNTCPATERLIPEGLN